ncbi:Bifunctional transcriptional activator/DNA repair enzyme AdaA [Ureibacillus acetophenoni]
MVPKLIAERIVKIMMAKMNLSFEEMWEKIIACDQKYDGLFYTAVKTTKIYCRPSCKSRKPKKINVEFYDDITTVEKAGYRPCKRCQPEVEHSPHVGIVKMVITFLVNQYKQNLRLQDIAENVGLSPYYLERLFKQETSETPRTYLEKIRVDKAAHLLKTTSMTNMEICLEVGFQSPSNFYKVFRRLKNCSPSEYRKEFCNDELY